MRRHMRVSMLMLSILATLALFTPGNGHAAGSVTTILSVDTAAAVYGDPVSVRATLTDADTGAGISRQLVSFLVSDRFYQAVTDADGIAVVPAVALRRLRAGVYPGAVRARFDGQFGSTVYEASTGVGDLQVVRRPLRVLPESVSREYGDQNPATLPYRLENFAYAEDEQALITRPACTTPATIGSDVGTYAITCSGLAADNYEGDYRIAGVLTVTPAPMTIRPDDQVKPQGQSGANLTATYLGTWKLGQGPEVLTGTLKCGSAGASQWAAAGSYPIACTGQTSTNYALKYAEGTLRVTPPVALKVRLP